MFLIIEKRMILSTYMYKQLLNHNLMYHVSYKHTTWKKNDGVNSFLVTVWLSMIVRSLRRRKKTVQQQVGLPIMTVSRESRLIHIEPYCYHGEENQNGCRLLQHIVWT